MATEGTANFAIGDTVERINAHGMPDPWYRGVVLLVIYKDGPGLWVTCTENLEEGSGYPAVGEETGAPFTYNGKPCWRRVEPPVSTVDGA